MFGKTWNVRSLRKYKAVFLFFGKGSWHFPNNTNTLVLAFSVLSIEPRALCLLSVGCTTELFLQLLHYWFSTHKLLCQYHFTPSCLQPRSCLPYAYVRVWNMIAALLASHWISLLPITCPACVLSVIVRTCQVHFSETCIALTC